MASFVTPPRLAKKPSLNTTALTPAGRKVLPNGRTASLIRDLPHSCSELVKEYTLAKTAVRVYQTSVRFIVVDAMDCHTSRGSTRLNGSRCHCQCQAAHASITPNLYDDKLSTVVSIIEERGFDQLSPFSKQYTQRRLNLRVFSPNTCKARLKQLSNHQKKSSFAGTDFEYQRNATFENPKGSNMVDTLIEKDLRPFEDLLADQCYEEEVSVQQAMEIFVNRYMKQLKQAKENIQIKQQRFEAFVSAHESVAKYLDELYSHVTTIDPAEYALFIAAARVLLKAKEDLQEKLPGVSSFRRQLKALHSPSIFAPLQTLVDNYDQAKDKAEAIVFFQVIRRIDCSNPLVSFDEIRTGMGIRLVEAETQILALETFVKMPPNYAKDLFGEMDGDGHLRTPTKADIQRQLLDQMHSLEDSSTS